MLINRILARASAYQVSLAAILGVGVLILRPEMASGAIPGAILMVINLWVMSFAWQSRIWP